MNDTKVEAIRTQWIYERELLNNKMRLNLAQYKNIEHTLTHLKGKYIAFADNQIKICSDNINEVSKYHDDDPTAVILQV